MDPVYLDYAATSALRPPEVVEAMVAYLRDIGATPGRSGHRRAVEAGRIVLRCRLALTELFGARGDPGRVVFTSNATHALNIAMRGLLRPGDRVVRTAYDHNAVRRPVAALVDAGVEEAVLAGTPDGALDLDAAQRALEGNGRPARVLVVPHASNVLGALVPVAELSELAHAVGAVVVVDAAQSAGHVVVDAERIGADVLCFAGHKGLLGPQGTGGLWVRPGVQIDPLLVGGTGADSYAAEMPTHLPDRLEAGTLNGPGIAGLLAGVRWVAEQEPSVLHGREAALKARLRRALTDTPGVEVHSPPDPEGVGIVLATVTGIPSAEVARRLDRDWGVLARAGLHCSPDTHALLGTAGEGAVRFSLGWASTVEDVDRAIAAIAAIAATTEPAFRKAIA